MAIFMGFGLGMLFAFILMVIIGGFFMWLAAKIAQVEKSTFGRAIAAAIGSSAVTLVIAFVFDFFPIIGNLLGFIIGLFLSIFVIKAAFDTSFGKAVLVWIFDVIAKVVAVMIATVLVAGSLAFLGCL